MSKVFYAISKTPEGTLPFSAGYVYMAARWIWNEEIGKLEYEEGTDFFKTSEEAVMFIEEHPEYRPMAEVYKEVRRWAKRQRYSRPSST